MRYTILALVLLRLATASAFAQHPTLLTTADGLSSTADVYRAYVKRDAPWIVLAHQAGASRGEYRTIAPRLNALGFNALALDQRSGRAFAGVGNTAVRAARKLNKRQGYLAARPDIEAGIAWAREQTTGKVILWGSSYSAALALLLAGENATLVDGVVANSPGEYLKGKTIWRAAQRISVPVLITSPAEESDRWQKIYGSIPGDTKTGFAPEVGGVHGSSSFIGGRNGSSEAFWTVAQKFLTTHFK